MGEILPLIFTPHFLLHSREASGFLPAQRQVLLAFGDRSQDQAMQSEAEQSFKDDSFEKRTIK